MTQLYEQLRHLGTERGEALAESDECREQWSEVVLSEMGRNLVGKGEESLNDVINDGESLGQWVLLDHVGCQEDTKLLGEGEIESYRSLVVIMLCRGLKELHMRQREADRRRNGDFGWRE